MEIYFNTLKLQKRLTNVFELFRMKLSDRFTQVHLWPNCFVLSVEWFTMKNNEQIGVGISPGGDDYESPYLYVNPYPFDEKMVDRSLAIGKRHTTGWYGIKVEWNELEHKIEQKKFLQQYMIYF